MSRLENRGDHLEAVNTEGWSAETGLQDARDKGQREEVLWLFMDSLYPLNLSSGSLASPNPQPTDSYW